jgi:hypothetical protein
MEDRMPEHEELNLVDLGHRIARNTCRKLLGFGYTPEQLALLFPEMGDADEIGVWIRDRPEVATSVGPLRTIALRRRAEALAEE